VANDGPAELVFVVDVSSFTRKGFVGSTTYDGAPVAIDFDDADKGVSLSSEMAKRLKVRKGSRLSIAVESEQNLIAESEVLSVGKGTKISSAKIYYAIGREGGAVIRVRKG